MKLCFYQRLAVAMVLVFVLVSGALLWSVNHLQALSRSEAEQQLHLGLASHLVADNPLLKQGVYDYSALKNLFHTLMLLGPAFEYYYLDPKGRILSYSAEAGKVKVDRLDIAPILSLLDGEQSLPIFAQDPKQPHRQKIFSAAEVTENGTLQGYLFVIIGGEAHDSILASLRQNDNLRQYALIALIALVALLAICLLLLHQYTAPLRRLAADMQTLCDDGFEPTRPRNLANWRNDSYNELQRLGCVFRQMLGHIDDQFSQLQQIDNQRRVLLADLSHDLRTPLANLQGYMETLAIQGDKLSAADRSRFTQICLKNARNLKKLIDQIFELAYLEGGQVTLKQECFPIGELLHDVVAKFALKAEKKGVQLRVVSTHSGDQVQADISKLERVLTNLIDNAIRHTEAGGSIEINASPQAGKVRIDVRDSGVGICQSEVAFIFDARYQATNSNKDSNLHAGLGLAISKKLTALLGSDLLVTSELGKGTCFSFELQQV